MREADSNAESETGRPWSGPSVNLDRFATLAISCIVSLAIHAAMLLAVAVGSNDVIRKVTLDATLNRSPHQIGRLETSTGRVPVLSTLPDASKRLKAPLRRHRPATAPSRPDPTENISTVLPEVINNPDGTSEVDGLIRLPGPYYFDPSELTDRPQLMGDLFFRSQDMVFSTSEGRIVIELLVNSGGLVDDVIVIIAEVPVDVLNSTVRTFRGATYMPGQLNGQAVNSKIRIEVRFSDDP